MSDVPALVLDDPSVSAEELRHFAGFPGLWQPGRPIAVTELGFDTAEDAAAKVEELGLPLAAATVAAGDGLMPDVDNHALGQDEARALELQAVEEGHADEEASLLDGKADDAITAIAAVATVEELDQLEAAEQTGKNRTTVLAAITSRRGELAEIAAATEQAPLEGAEG